ncbi:Ca2+:H+ antiporter [Roseibium hamelinense]|uniref:Ca2+:H+ antiporter n=1 Tax=Roseibium hamelinense TaxID=150831 RepID=A0A562TJ56_9HYPH|nr:calcium:proton antiporter [Roseibium hamelinense]MTI46097.1 calcium:proton antiporter [Roseibium hamelinense]TWI92710.1 Ca2+:H+ antiporter [Roseibium hamelinense]
MTAVKSELASLIGFLLFGLFLLFGGALYPSDIGLGASGLVLAGLFAVMAWCAFSVVRHAECLATLLGEPYGTLILTLAVIGIEVALISAVMLAGDASPAMARDTMFSVVMIVLNGLVGLCLLFGGLRHTSQTYNLQGANAFLSVLIPLAIFALVLPRATQSAPGGQLSHLQAGFDIVMSVVLYGVFLAIQTRTHSDIFQQPEHRSVESHHDVVVRSIPFHVIGLFGALLPIILLSKKLALYVDFGIAGLGAPIALSGFLVAALILMPEGLSAIQAARDNMLQRAVNICLGSAVATIGLTVPAVLAIGWYTGQNIELALEVPEIILLALTLFVSVVTFVSPQTNYLQGAVHLALFGAYVMMIFDLAG